MIMIIPANFGFFQRTKSLPTLNQGRNVDRIIQGCSIDSVNKRGYFATRNTVFEIDMNTLSIITEIQYTNRVGAISEVSPGVQLTVATSQGLQFWDAKSPPQHCIHWRDCSYTRLPDPSPLSILHQPDFPGAPSSSSIWVAGRFSHLLNYDTRMLPHVKQTVHSGAHICSLSLLPNCYFTERAVSLTHPVALLPVSEIKTFKGIPGHTLLAGGNYRGRGSVELYGLPSPETGAPVNKFTSRFNLGQTMAVAHHGGKIVTADSNGMLKWMERDGLTPIRSYNINTVSELEAVELGQLLAVHAQISPRASAAAQTWGNQDVSWDTQDLVQRIMPTRASGDTQPARLGKNGVADDDLVIWTAEGRLGHVGFGNEMWHWEEELDSLEYAAAIAEEEYYDRMKRLLIAHGDELNSLPRFGMA
jgi:hypothetical protein